MTESQMYTAEVIADSISPEGHRITTVRAVYPHAVHKDMLRHRAFNRNVESFRAQPPEKLIEMLRNGHAFKPEVFAKRVKGMGQSKDEIADAREASWLWDQLLERALITAENLLQRDVAKQQVNFVLQDFCPLTEIITATDWSNFYALRTELKEDGTPMARPEVYKTALAIREAIEASTPQQVRHGWLHLPMITGDELAQLCLERDDVHGCRPLEKEAETFWIEVSAGRCARISYGDFDWRSEEPKKSAERARRLLSVGHLSPYEQQARCFSKARWDLITEIGQNIDWEALLPLTDRREMIRQLEYSGNLHGWCSARSQIPFQYDYSLMKQHASDTTS